MVRIDELKPHLREFLVFLYLFSYDGRGKNCNEWDQPFQQGKLGGSFFSLLLLFCFLFLLL